MLVPIDTWFDEVAKLLPENCNFKLDLLRRGVDELRKLDVGFRQMPTPTRHNINYGLGKIRHDVTVVLSDPKCANWAKQVYRRLRGLEEALRAGVV